MKKLNSLLTVLLYGTLVLSFGTLGKSLDSGVPQVRTYTRSELSAYIGQKVTVSYINCNNNDRITLQVLGVLWDRFKKGDKYLLLGYTEFKNRMVIPIEKIYLIEEIK